MMILLHGEWLPLIYMRGVVDGNEDFMVQGEFFMAAGKVTARGRELSESWKGGYGRNVGRRVMKIARGGKYYSMHHEERRISAYWRSFRRLMGVAYWGSCTKRRRPSTIFRGFRRRSLVRLHRRRFSRLIEDFFYDKWRIVIVGTTSRREKEVLFCNIISWRKEDVVISATLFRDVRRMSSYLQHYSWRVKPGRHTFPRFPYPNSSSYPTIFPPIEARTAKL